VRTVFAIALVALLAVTASGQICLELGGSPVRYDIPDTGSPWHELFPNFCVMHNQTGYSDNGDGVVSECDAIFLDGLMYHIDWAGPTYYLYNTETGDVKFLEPTSDDPGANPVGEIWHEVAPAYCTEWEIMGWDDNGNGVVDPCDIIVLAGDTLWHIEEVRLDITVSPESPVEDSTWGQIKSFFRNLF